MDVATVYPLGAEISLTYRKLRDLHAISAKLFLQLRRPRIGHRVVSSECLDLGEHDRPHTGDEEIRIGKPERKTQLCNCKCGGGNIKISLKERVCQGAD